MAVTCNFMDDQPVTAADLNEIGRALHAEQPTAYDAATPIGVDQLNQITKNLISKGVCSSYGNRCQVSKAAGSNVKVDTGRGFFDNGAVMTLDAPVTVPYPSGTGGYVWLKYDFDANAAEVVCTEENPSVGASSSLHYVLLAQVSGSGVVTDKREYALMKNSSVLPNRYLSYPGLKVSGSCPTKTLLKTIQLGVSGLKYAYVKGEQFRGFVDFDNNTYVGYYSGGSYGGSFQLIPVSLRQELYLELSGSTLFIYGKNDLGISLSATFDLILL